MSQRDWERTRLKYVVEANRSVLAESTDPDHTFTYIDIGNVSQGVMNLEGEVVRFADAPSRARRLARPGDSIISTVRTYLRAVATVPDTEHPLVFSTGFAVLEPSAQVHPAWMAYYLQGDEFVDRVVAHSEGVSYPAISAAALMSLPLALPPLSEQRAIADYLDAETAKIDALIGKQQSLIETLRERRAAVVDLLIGPATGPLAQLRHLTRVPIEAGLDAQSDTNNPAEWPRFVRTTDISTLTRLHPERRVTVPEAAAARAPLARGDIVATRAGATIGKTHIYSSDEPACYAGYLVSIRVDPRKALPMYVAAWTTSMHFQDQVAVGAVKSTIENFSASKYRATQIPLPPLDDQRSIVAHLDKQTAKIDALIAKAERFIEVSKERRSALITAAVTGQIDVRTAAPVGA